MDDENQINQLRMYTVQEANGLIPQLTELIHQVQAKKKQISFLEVEIDLMELVGGGKSKAVQTGMAAYEKAVNEFYGIIDSIHQFGCMLKDVDRGLVDFYTVYQGRVVYLCWQLGETEITCWHDIGKGYTSRTPLEPQRDIL
ncbi:MAG TPA: DUF2203 domain-containing protein [Verrucomicrobiae bacterium]|nr:DUF2203 domain-containing protein [Verrucomicrobiae bacterium]